MGTKNKLGEWNNYHNKVKTGMYLDLWWKRCTLLEVPGRHKMLLERAYFWIKNKSLGKNVINRIQPFIFSQYIVKLWE